MFVQTNPAPVTLGSPSRRLVLPDMRVTEASYPPRARLPRHYHEMSSITLVTAGAFEERFDRRAVACRRGDVLAKCADAAHSNSYGTAGASCLLIEFGVERLSEPSLERLFDGHRFLPNGGQSRCAEAIVHELRRADAWTPLAIEGLILEWLAWLSRVDASTDRGRAPWLRTAREILAGAMSKPVRLTEVAAMVGVTPGSLARGFRREFGMSPGDFVREHRYVTSLSLLRTEQSISAIALSLGFADESHFIRFFRRWSGETPGRYRKRMKGAG